MQKEKRRRVFRTGFSIEDGEPIYLYGAIESRVFHGTFLLGLGQQISGCEHQRGHERYTKGLHIGAAGDGLKGAGMRRSLG